MPVFLALGKWKQEDYNLAYILKLCVKEQTKNGREGGKKGRGMKEGIRRGRTGGKKGKDRLGVKPEQAIIPVFFFFFF